MSSLIGDAATGTAPGAGPYLVFAHYMPCYKAYGFSATDGFWFDQQFSPEPGSRGGLTSRPIVYPLGSGDPQLDAIVSDIRLAKTYGINGFLVDELADAGGYNAEWQRLLKGAEIVGGFKIGIMPDYATLHDGTKDPGREQSIKDWIDLAANSPALLRYHGKPVVFPYGDGFPDGRDPKTLELLSAIEKHDIIGQLAAQGTKVAYAPCIGVDWQLYKVPYAKDPKQGFQTFSFAVGSFSPTAPQKFFDAELSYWPKSMMVMGENTFLYYNRGWCYSTGQQDLTEYYRSHWEWNIAHRDRLRWVMLVTWNDWGETAIAPSVNHFMAWQPITRYYSSWFKTGVKPAITQDTIEIFHRPHPFAATPTRDPFDVKKPTGYFQLSTPNDVVEALAFLKAPATLVIHTGNTYYRQALGAGVQSLVRPFSLGVQSASIERNGRTVAYVVSPVPITNSPARQNLWYIGADSQHPPRHVPTAAWTTIAGKWDTARNERSGSGLSISGDPMQLSDCSITARIAVHPGAVAASAGVVAHAASDGTSYYSFSVGSTAGKATWQLAKVDKGVQTLLSSGAFAGNPNAAHTLRLDCVGEYRIGYIDGVLVTQVSDYPVIADYELAFGRGGVMTTGATATFDNISMRSYDPNLIALNGPAPRRSAYHW